MLLQIKKDMKSQTGRQSPWYLHGSPLLTITLRCPCWS